MKITQIVKWTTAAIVILFIALILKPVPEATVSNTYDVHDQILEVFKVSSLDVVFKLKNKDGFPYINRGLQAGLNIEALNNKLKGQEVLLKFVDHWTPLDFNKSSPTIAYIKIDKTGVIVYNNITS